MNIVVASLFNLGGPDLIIILAIMLLLFGAKRLPELARGLGQAMNEFNKAKDDMQRQITRADEPVFQPAREAQPRTVEAVAPPVAQPAPVAPVPQPAESVAQAIVPPVVHEHEQPRPLA